MSEQEQKELCILLSKLLVNMYDECDDITDCNLGFTIADHRVQVHMSFKIFRRGQT